MNKKLSIKKILSLFLVLMFVFSIFSISRASADTKAFNLTNSKVQEKSDTAEAEVSLSDGNIKSNVVFHKVSDYVIYKFTFKNNDDKDYVIKSISDDNTNPYIKYTYDQYKDTLIKSGDSIDVLIKLTYDAEVNDIDKRDINENVKFSFNIEDQDGNKVVSNVSINPKTNDNIAGYIVLSIVSFGGLVLIFVKNKKLKKTIACFVLLAPFVVNAVDSSFELTFKMDIKLRDKLAVEIDNNGEKETKVVSYEDKFTKPEDPEKRGYEFLGWYDKNGKEYDFDSKVDDDVKLSAKYKIINYTIDFDYAGGVAINPLEYNVESDSITLVNPIKPGYSFSGWTGSNGEVYQTRVTIDKGSIGNLTFKANFSANEDTAYTVKHRYLNLDGETYVEEVEELTGTTDTTVRPQGKHKDGFVDKEDADLENLVITGDGKAELIYVYDRVMLNLSYNEDVESDFAEGQYKFGTPITISAKEKTGYTFNKWNVNTNGSPIFINTNDDENEISLGDVVIIGTDWFYVIAPENGEVKLLPKFNLNRDARQSINSDTVVYSSSNYWNSSSDYTSFGNSSYKYVYRTSSGEETDNYLKTRINDYKDYLNSLNIVAVNDARLMSYEEALVAGCSNFTRSCPTWVANQSYWLGSANGSNYVWTVGAYARFLTDNAYNYDFYYDGIGVRPVVIISSSDISSVEDSNTQSIFNIEEDTYLAPSYNPNKDTAYKVVHKKQDQNDESVYTTETENKTGITGDTISPDVKTTYGSGYVVPNKETTTIAADGSTTVTYTYNYRYYNVSYDANGGSVNTESVDVYKGQSTTPPKPTLSGYSFIGWYDAAEGGNPIVEPDESFTPTSNITLYAHWEVNNNPIAYLNDLDGDLDISLGDKVTIGEDEFYYIGRDDNNNLKLLAKYNLDNNYRQSENYNYYEYLSFSDTNYWNDNSSAGSSSSSSSSSGSGSSSSYSFNTDSSGYKYVYRTSDNEDISENNLTYYVNNYKDYITSETEIDVNDARLMSYEEALVTGCEEYNNDTCPEWVANQYYWLGSASDNDNVWYVNADYRDLRNSSYGNNNFSGVRPVIIVSESDISMPWKNNDTILYSDTNNDGNISLGDAVRIGSEVFKVIDEPSNGEIKLLAMYNLDSTPRQSKNSGVMTYSGNNYWSSSSDYTPFGSSSYNYIYRTTANRFTTDGDTNNNLKTRINSYKNYLNGLNIVTINDARLMSYEEAEATGCSTSSESCPTWLANEYYWLGSAHNYGDYVWYVDAYNRFICGGNGHIGGVRPVITISSCDFSPNSQCSSYTVVHKKQSIDDESVYEIEETETKTGLAGEEISPAVKSTYGTDYAIPSVQTTTIAADGSTVVEYLYNYKYYNVTLDPNGGTVETESVLVNKGSSVSLPLPNRDGYRFIGWYDAAEEGNLESEPNAAYTPNKNIILYAQWEEFDYTPVLSDEDNDLDISIGDKLTVGDNEFYFIGRDENDNLKFLAKYNLNSDARQSSSADGVTYSSSNYWSNSSDYTPFGSSSYNYIYRTTANRFTTDGDTNNNLKTRINSYKDYLNGFDTLTVIDARLMSYEEALKTGCSTSKNSCPEWVANQTTYWLGSAYSINHVWFVSTVSRGLYDCDYYCGYRVRPVIIVSESDISMPWENNNTVLYSDANNDGNISLGDFVRIGSEGFRVIDEPINGEVKLLAAYNLNDTPRQSLNSDTMSYSSGNYWNNSPDYTPFGSSKYVYIYRTTANRFTTDGDTNNNLKTRINSYKNYLNGLNIVAINDARLMSYEEASVTGCSISTNSCPEWLANQSYWLGSAGPIDCVWGVIANDRGLVGYIYFNDYGVRPVITISESDIPTN